MVMNTIEQNLQALRREMQLNNIDLFIVGCSDPHLSEYMPDHWKIRAWISGFTGSAGTVVVGLDEAFLWTDVRYFLQAERELENTGITLMKLKSQGISEYIDYICTHSTKFKNIGIDFSLNSHSEILALKKQLSQSGQNVLNIDLISNIWKNRPPLPNGPVFEHELKYAGRSFSEKVQSVRKVLENKKANSYLVTALDDIAWLFNLRGSDVECNPVFLAFAYVSLTHVYLFIDDNKIPHEINQDLCGDGITCMPYTDLPAFLSHLPIDTCLLIDIARINAYLYSIIQNKKLVLDTSPITILKSQKNETEILNLKHAMILDGVAILKTQIWLENKLKSETVKETDVAQNLINNRSLNKGYFGESFNAIVGYQANGAIIHYRPEEESCADIKNEGILLVDSGGQYHFGTTDITRTWALGMATAEQKTNYTLVLKGHIQLATIEFPVGTKGVQLDILARMYLWKAGLNYGHGTGHGVGFFLNVHEPPQGIVSGLNERGVTPIMEGSLTSNEPGFYLDGQYGIRLENLILAVKSQETDFGSFLKFETVSLYPFDLNLIDLSILSSDEIAWINDYHDRVYNAFLPYLDSGEKEWLQRQCAKI